MKNQLWVEKYRPKTVDGYVFTDENQKNQARNHMHSQKRTTT